MIVKDEFRTHPWSIEPGGVTVCVIKTNGKLYEYDKVKNVKAYIKAAKENKEVVKIWVKDSSKF